MGIMRWDPFHEQAQLREQVNRLFAQSLMHDEDAVPGWAPAVDIMETDDAIILQVDLAGVKPETIDIRMTGDTLTIAGERTPPAREDCARYLRVERRYGAFRRAFTLGVPVNESAVKAVYHDGVLDITLPKRAEAQPKQVKVTVEEM